MRYGYHGGLIAIVYEERLINGAKLTFRTATVPAFPVGFLPNARDAEYELALAGSHDVSFPDDGEIEAMSGDAQKFWRALREELTAAMIVPRAIVVRADGPVAWVDDGGGEQVDYTGTVLEQ